MAWAISRNPLSESNLTNTNMWTLPFGTGVPLSSSELNGSFITDRQALQDLYTSLAPSGFMSRIFSVSSLDTATGTDQDGELVALLTSGVPVANTIRLGRSFCSLNGWQVPVQNTAGTGGIHNNITLDAAPSAGTRIDLVFLEVWLAELGGTSASISNTANKPDATNIYLYGNTQYAGTNATDDISEIDAEINRRWQIQYRIRVVDGVGIDTYPDGVNDTVNVKAWGANPGGTWSGFTAGTGSVYTFSNQGALGDSGLFIAGDGSVTAKSVLGTVDGYVYAIPICAVARRNSGVFNAATNAYGCAPASGTGGNIASSISGRPDGLFYDQIAEGDILSLRHQVFVHGGTSVQALLSDAYDDLMRGNLTSLFGVGDGVGAPSGLRSTHPLYGQEISTVGALDAGFKGFSQFNYQRRIFSDAAVVQQTEFTWMGGTAPDNTKPSVLSAPATPTGSTSTASGSLAAATYYVEITYTNQYGETTVSTEASFTLSGTGTLTINSPVSSGNASGYNIYISTSTGTETKQNSSPIAIGTNYSQATALISGSAKPSANTTSSTLVIAADSSGLTNGTAIVECVDGTISAGAGSLPTNANILVYEGSTFATVAGTWSGLGTDTATFTPSSTWSSNAQTNGVAAIVGIAYPAGNGLTYRPDDIVGQTLIQGASSFTMAQIGVSGVAAADDKHLDLPQGVAIDTNGNIYVADTNNHRVVQYNSSFVKQNQFGATGISGADNTHLNSPVSVVVDNAGNIYISDTGNHRVVKLNSSFSYVSQFGVTGVSGNDTSHLNLPQQIALDSGQANIYIADSDNNRVVRITTALAYGASTVTGLTYKPVGMAVDANGNIYTTQGHSVTVYNSGGTLVSTFGTAATPGSTPYTCNSPQHIALAWDGGFIFCDSGNNRLVHINSRWNIYTGQFGVTGKSGSDFGHLNTPFGIGIDSNGLIYVGDTNNDRMLKLHKEMGACYFPNRQFEVLYSGASTDRLQLWYKYRPYQGVFADQGNALTSYTLRGLTDLQLMVTTCGTGGVNTDTSDNLNGFVTRLPLPGLDGVTKEWTFTGADLTIGTALDSAGIITLRDVSWGGSMSVYGPSSPDGNQMGPLLSGKLIELSQATSTAYPERGVNTIARLAENINNTSAYDYLGLSAAITNSVDHLTIGYFLAAASGGADTLPLEDGEVVLVAVTFRVNGTRAVIYGQTSTSVAADIFRLPSRPIIRYA